MPAALSLLSSVHREALHLYAVCVDCLEGVLRSSASSVRSRGGTAAGAFFRLPSCTSTSWPPLTCCQVADHQEAMVGDLRTSVPSKYGRVSGGPGVAGGEEGMERAAEEAAKEGLQESSSDA